MQRHTLTFRSKKRTKILVCYLVFVFFVVFVCFRDPKKQQFFGIPLNSATIASEKCHYCKVKQAILTSKIGTIPVLKWLRSDSTKIGFVFRFRKHTKKTKRTKNKFSEISIFQLFSELKLFSGLKKYTKTLFTRIAL